MADENLTPVIFLAFANAREDRVRYLRNLPEEARRLRKLLTQAKREKLCEIIVRENATLDDILDVFQDPQYDRRIAIFHFGGHANGYQLLVESAAGKTAVANARGLAAFFGQQTGLELVFLNGCSTQRQVQGLLDAGVSAVIATLCEIDDKVATNFAGRFYMGLSSGVPIEIAFKEAQAAIQTGSAEVRHLYASEQFANERLIDQWPWALYTRRGAESALQWNLPDAVNNPLFGLPKVKHADLPELPFRHLNWFGREHAAIFFGRGYQIRELYQRITTPSTDEPIILLYGQSGVGKSSLLDAGLRPYLEQSHQIAFHRRDPVLGLCATLQMALGDPTAIIKPDTWLNAEKRLRKPLVVILDQVEEIFTRARPELADELAIFLAALRTIFADQTHRPRGRLILTFRKEWLAEISEQMFVYKLPCAKILVDRLDRRGVVEAVTGIARDRRLKQHYGLTVAPEVGGIIADDLLVDLGSPVAPILQILLAEMWEEAKKENYDHPHFSQELYQCMKMAGLRLEDFLDKQLAKLQESHKDDVASGLALDILAFHTTRFGTAEQHSESKLQQTYGHCKTVLPVLLQRFKDLYLLVDLAQNQPVAERMSRLAHDTLAPVVRARFEESDQPGQRALRILTSRALDWEEKKKEESDSGARKILAWLQKEQMILGVQDLALVERGEIGMRTRTKAEDRLVLASKAARTRRRLFLGTFVALLLGAILFSGALWQARQGEAFNRQREVIGRQADQAQQQLMVNPLLALHISRNALPNTTQPYVPKAEFVFHQAVHAFLERNYLSVSRLPLTAERFAWGGTRIAFTDGNLIKLVSYQLAPTRTVTLTDHLAPVSAIQWHEDGQTLLSYDQETVRVWRDGEPMALYETNPQTPITCAKWRPTRDEIVLCQGNELQIWSPATDIVAPLHMFTDTLVTAVWSPNGQQLAAWDNQRTLLILNMETEPAVPLRLQANAHPRRIRMGAWSLDEQQLVTVSLDGTLHFWSLSDGQQDWETLHSRALLGAQFISNTHFVTWGGTGDTARLWSINGQQERWFGAESDAVQDIRYDERGLMTFADNGDVQLWDVGTGRRLALFRGHSNYVVDAQWQGVKLATASVDGTARVWEIDQTQQRATRELVVKENPVILRGYESIGSNQRKDVLGVSWQDDQYLLTISLDGTVRRWQVYDEWGQPLCRGVDGDGYPRCFNQSRLLTINDAPIVTAQWVNSDTVRAVTSTSVMHVAISGVHSDTLPITPITDRNMETVWSPDSRQVFTYVKALTTTDNVAGIIYDIQSHAVITPIPGPIESAFWLEPGLLISRPFTEVLFIEPNTKTAPIASFRRGCRVEQRCALTTAAFHRNGWLAIGDERGVVYLWNIEDEINTPFTLSFSQASVCPTDENATSIDWEVPVDELLWFRDGKHLLMSGRLVVLWDIEERKALWCYPSAGLKTHVALSPDERLIAITMDRVFHVLDAEHGQPLWLNSEHDEAILGLQWTSGRTWPTQLRATLSWVDWVRPWVNQEQGSDSGDERLLLLTWSGDGTARLWEWHSRSEIFRATGIDNDDRITAAGINDAGTWLFTATHQGALRLWPLWLQMPEKAIDVIALRPLPIP